MQGFDAAQLIDAALTTTGGDTADKDRLRAALRGATIASPRGAFRLNSNGFPVQDFYLVQVARRADGRFETQIRQKVFTAYADRFAKGLPDQVARPRPPSVTLLLVQFLNGLQLGMLLFLIAAGLTLVFGVLDIINLAHGLLYMLGAYLAVGAYAATGSVWLALPLATAGSFAAGLLLDAAVFRPLVHRGHLDQVLATFGLILLGEDAARLAFGPAPRTLPLPPGLDGTVTLPGGLLYPQFRLALLAAGLAAAALLWFAIERTRAGMLVRAGASNAPILSALGVDVSRLFALVLGTGAALAGFAGAVAAPPRLRRARHGRHRADPAFVVVVVGGLGSVRGAFLAAVLVGLTDTLGRTLLTDGLRLLLGPAAVRTAGPALASMAVYVLMAASLALRPRGLLPARGGA